MCVRERNTRQRTGEEKREGSIIIKAKQTNKAKQT